MDKQRAYVVDFISAIVGDSIKAEMVVERLQDEGLLVFGYGDKDVERIIQKFTEVYGTTKVTKNDRFAANRLARKYGSQAIVGIITLLAEHSSEKFAPVVGSVSQLEDKLVSVIHFLRSFKGREEI